MSAALPTPIDCCGLQNCPSSSGGGGGGGNTANLKLLHLAGLMPPNLTPLDLPQEWVDMDTNARYLWNGFNWQVEVGPP